MIAAPPWTPRHGHVTQMRANPDGTTNGREDCFEAAYARLLFETYFPAGVKVADDVLIDQVALVARGVADTEWNDPTTLPECVRAFQHYGTRYIWTASYDAALASRFAICLVDGTALTPAQYPASWFGNLAGQSNHFILWLPSWNGADNWYNDPLVEDTDCRYDLASVQSAWGGAYLVADEQGVIEAEQLVAINCALKVNPNHTCKALARLSTGQLVLELSQANGWSQITAGSATGWVPLSNLRPAAV